MRRVTFFVGSAVIWLRLVRWFLLDGHGGERDDLPNDNGRFPAAYYHSTG